MARPHPTDRVEPGHLAEEQAALRRVATLVARGAPPRSLFAVVAEQVALVLHVPLVSIVRYEGDGTATECASFSAQGELFAVGTRWSLDGTNVVAQVRASGRPARIDDYSGLEGLIAEAVRSAGIVSTVGIPIVVAGRLWGAMVASAIDVEPGTASSDASLPDNIEDRLADFTALVATAISNSQAREDLRMLADEHAGLRRVATLVAEGATPAEVFAAVAREVGLVLKMPLVGMFRYEPDDTATGIGATGEHPFQPGTNWPLDGPSMTAVVRRTGRPARIEDYATVTGTIGEASQDAGFHTGVAAPIVVDGEVWGVVCAGTADAHQPVPADAERRLSQFTALVATAISNTQAREDLRRLADEQAALRRLATLVAQGAEPGVVFDAVCEETGRVVGASSIHLAHFTSDDSNVTMASWSVRDGHEPAGTRLALDGDSIRALVHDTAASGRVESYQDPTGPPAGGLQQPGIRSEVGAPVVVEGRVWGALIAASDGPDRLPVGTEVRLESFAELIATAVANAAARSELVESRVRIVEAADQQRRRVARDLHDGAQSRLIHAVIALERVQARDDVPPELRPLVQEGLTHTRSAISELRELARGIHPAILTHHGLAAAIEVLADRAPLTVRVAITDERYATAIESAAYFVAAEALTNVVKYAHASTARITATHTLTALRLEVEDDGVGGARSEPGAGLAGLGDRLAALDGVLTIDSPPGAGTRIRADIPLPAQS